MSNKLKILITVFASITFIIAIFFIVPNLIPDEKLNPEISEFLKDRPEIFYNDNAFIGAVGLVAPANVKNSYDWAKKIIEEKSKQNETVKLEKLYNTIENSSENLTQDIYSSIDGVLEFKGDKEFLGCWQREYWKTLVAPPGKCDDENEVKKQVQSLLKDNALLLRRYINLSQYKNFSQGRFVTTSYSPNLFSAHQLFIEDLVRISNSDPVGALSAWRENLAFVEMALSDYNSITEKSLFLSVRNYSLIALPILLDAQRKNNLWGLAVAHSDIKIKDASEVLNFEKTLKADYSLFEPILEKLSNRNKNKFFAFIKDFNGLKNFSAKDFASVNNDFLARYNQGIKFSDLGEIKESLATNLIIKGAAGASAVLGIMHNQTALSRMLNLYILMNSSGVKAEDAESFINKNEEFKNPYTEAPFVWDANDKTISFTAPDNTVKSLIYKN